MSARSRSSAGPPTAHGTPSMIASTPRPVSARNARAEETSPRCRAAVTIALASGCSLSDSTAPARRNAPSSSSPLIAATPVTTWAPLVRVPVLSNSTVSIERMRSSARRSLTRMPALADTAVDSEITSGIAKPSVRAGDDEHRDGSHDGVIDVAGERPRHERDDAGSDGDVEQQGGEAVSERLGAAVAGLRAGHEALIPASAVSSPTASTRTRTDESVEIVPATTPPALFATGLDSPVIIDSSSSASPSMITPSAGTRPPERTARGRRAGGRRSRRCARRRRRRPRLRQAAARPTPPTRPEPGRSPSSPASARAA